MINAAEFAEVLWPKLVELQSHPALGSEPSIALLAGAIREVQIDAMQATPTDAPKDGPPEGLVGRFFETDEGQLAFDLR